LFFSSLFFSILGSVAMLPAGPASSAARVLGCSLSRGRALLAVLFPHLAGGEANKGGRDVETPVMGG